MKPILSAILSVESTSLSDDEKRLLEKYNPLGVALFARNIQSKEQIKVLTQSIKETIGRKDVVIALDQEGGRVDRLKSIREIPLASQHILGKLQSKKITKAHALLVADEMLSLGANFNFAPVLDLDYPETTNALKSRMFSKGAKKTALLGRILWQTYVNCGICPCMKHLPGHGRAQNDPHLGLSKITASLNQLKRDFFPFIFNKDCPAAMTAHILLTEIDKNMPITFSKKGIKEVIRGIIGYDGFLISDALEMKALSGTIRERTEAAFAAGLDAVCYCMGDMKGLREVCEIAPFLRDKSLVRFEKIAHILKAHKSQTNLDLLKERYYTHVNLFAQEKVDYDATEVLFQLKKGIG